MRMVHPLPLAQELVKTVGSAVTTVAVVVTLVSWGVGLTSSLEEIRADMREIKAELREVKAGQQTHYIWLIGLTALAAFNAIAEILSPPDRTSQ